MRDIDAIVLALLQAHPELEVERLRVAHPGADDDGLWFFRHPGSDIEVQLESPEGRCPFVFESEAHGEARVADNVDEAMAWVVEGLGLTPSKR